MSGWQVGIDIGGTFTDLVALLPSSGEVRSIKVPTQRNDPVASIQAALAAAGLSPAEVDDLIHGTTLVTNAIVEDRVEPVALVATSRFSRTVRPGKMRRPSGTWARPRLTRLSAELLASGSPSKRIAPDLGRCRPEMVLSKVVLPAPLAPSNATTSPWPTSSEMPCSASIAP